MKDEFQASPKARQEPRYDTSLALPLTLLTVCGAGSLGLYHWARDLHRFIQGISGYTALFIAQFAIYLLAVFLVTRRRPASSRRAEWILAVVILVFAAVFRFDLVAQRPYLSTDVYRYVWDGRVQAAGINPYRYIPAAPELAHLRDEQTYPNINRRDTDRTPYPPGAQLFFLGAYLLKGASIAAFKSLLSMLDLIAIAAVMYVLFRAGLPPAQAIIFAWHPLLIYEGAHTGHVESAFIVCLALALLAWQGRVPALTGVALALATLIKYYPALLLPAFLVAPGLAAPIEPGATAATRLKTLFHPANLLALVNRANLWMMAGFIATLVLVHLPYLLSGAAGAGSLSNEFNEEGFTGSGERYFLVVLLRQWLPMETNLFLATAMLSLFGLGLWWSVQQKRGVTDVARAAVALIGLYFFLATPRYPWYYAWILPFLCFTPRLSWLYLTGASVLLYALWFTPLVYPEIPIWMGLAIFAPTLIFFLLESRRNERLPVSREDAPPTHSPVKSIS